MKKQYQKMKATVAKRKWPRWVRVGLRIIGVLVLLQFLGGLGVIWYVNTHKREIQQLVTTKLNENLNGKLSIQDMEPTFLENFPRISLHLKNVTIRDTMFSRHQKTLLKAGDFDIAVNAWAFLKGRVEVHKIGIGNAEVILFTDANGYSNSNVFKAKTNKRGDKPVYPELKKFELYNVNVTIDNQHKHKLFVFGVQKIDGKMSSDNGGWKASFSMQTLVNSLAFSTKKGSFIKQKQVKGDFDVSYTQRDSTIAILPNRLDIGGEDFKISAEFKTTKANTTDYAIHIVNDKILWRNASHLLTPNIYSRLDKFNLKEPIAVRCDISGNFYVEGDPFIYVNAKIKNNELTTPGGMVSGCSFTGIFTNNNSSGNGFNDANSAVKFEDFMGDYAGIPLQIKQAAILNLEHPIAVGNFKSDFELQQLGNLVDSSLIKFERGNAKVNLYFEADIVDYKLTKPKVTGTVEVKNGSVEYMPRKLKFSKTSVFLDFKKEDLIVNSIHVQSGRSEIDIQGEIRNFLNVYYASPEKVMLNWRVTSKQIHLAEFLKFIGKRSAGKPRKKKTATADFTDEINTLFEKSSVKMLMRVDKLYYNKFLATGVKADLLLSDAGIAVKNGSLQNANGNIDFNAALTQQGRVNSYWVNAEVNHVDVSRFFYSFDDFGLQSMNSSNLKGSLSATASLRGKIFESGKLAPNTVLGNVSFRLKDGALLNFDPVRKIGKFVFPRRDINTILFEDLGGSFAISGERVTIEPMQINSSVLNMDVGGVYSFGKGTNINISVPLRNPKRDADIEDAEELSRRRARGLVVRLQAVDGEDGKVKIKLVSKKTQLQSGESETPSVKK